MIDEFFSQSVSIVLACPKVLVSHIRRCFKLVTSLIYIGSSQPIENPSTKSLELFRSRVSYNYNHDDALDSLS